MDNDFRVGPWLVQPSLNSISENGTSTRLEPKVMEVLVCLAACPGETVPKEKLLQTVWPDTFVSDDVLKRSVSELRRVFWGRSEGVAYYRDHSEAGLPAGRACRIDELCAWPSSQYSDELR